MRTAEELLAQINAREPSASRCEVDLSDVLGDGVVFVYRAPTIYDLFAASDPRVQSDWRKRYPEMPDTLAVALELIARLHIAPPCQDMPVGEFYGELLTRLDTQSALRLVQRVEQQISQQFGLANIEDRVEEKKVRTSRARGSR